jgi:tetratricopeptide (TPR) repeat protein
MSRLAPKSNVIRALFALSGNQCAFPDCSHALISEKGTFISQICHIEAANKGGERYNPAQTDEERSSIQNLVLFCYAHHRETDDVNEFTVQRLKQIKKDHEDKFRHHPYNVPEQFFEKVFASIQNQLSHLIDVTEETNVVVHSLDEKMDKILRLTRSSSSEEDIFQSQLEFAKSLKSKGKHQTAIELLIDYKDKNWGRLNPQSQFRLTAHIGMCYLDLHNKLKAGEYLIQLKDIPYESADSLAALCLGYAITRKIKEFDNIFQKAVAVDELNINLWVAYCERHKNEIKSDDLLMSIPAQLRESVPILFAIGNMLIDEGKRKEGIEFLKKALNNNEETIDRISDTKALIATRITQLLVDPFKYAYRSYSKEELEQLDEAKKLFTDVWNFIENTELAKYKWHTILNRGVINKITGQTDSAISDFQKAFDLSHEFIAFKNLLFMHIQMSHLLLAEQLLNRPNIKTELTAEEKFEMQTFKARILCLKGQVGDAIDIMADLINEDNEKEVPQIITQIIAFCFENQLIDLATPWCEKMVSMFPALSTGYILSGYLWQEKGENGKSLDYYDKGFSLLQSSTSQNEIYELANGYMHLKEYEKAIPLFEKLANKNVINSFSKGLIFAYYKYGDLQAAFAFAENLFEQYPNNPFLAEIISNIYQETKQYDKAIELLEKFLPSNDHHINDVFSYRCARLNSFKRDWENTGKWAVQVKHPENFDLFESFTLARLFLQAGNSDRALDIAFNARTKYFQKADAHYNYFNLITAIEKDSSTIFPEDVRVESAVQIKMEVGEEKTFLITQKNIEGENVLRQNDSFALQLLGKKKGESILIDNGYGFSYSVTVIGIMDIYTHAFQETLKLLETRFAGQHPIGIIHHANPGAPDDPLEQLIKTQTIDNNTSEKKLLELYTQRKATIGMLATARRRNQVLQQFTLISSHDVSITIFSRNEHSAVDHAILNNTPIILDLAALITCFFIYRKQNLLSFLTNPIIVSQATISELHACYEELDRPGEDGLFTLTYEEGHLVSHTTPNAIIEEHKTILKNIIDWCNSHAQLMASKKQMEFRREERNKYSDAMGESSFDTMLLAEEYKGAVLSDDDNFNNFLRTGKTPLPFSSYGIAHWLLSKGKLTQAVFDEFRTVLIHANYIYIPVSADILWQSYDASAFQLKKPFTTAAKGLIIMLPEPCSKQLAAFLKKLYLSNFLVSTREQVVLYLSEVVSSRADYIILKSILVKDINEDFRLLSIFRKEVLELLTAF